MSRDPASARDEREFLLGLARAFGGALIFALPMLMTMEMWQLGFHIEPLKLMLLYLLLVPLLTGVDYFSGFKRTATLLEDVVDAFVAIAVSAAMACVVLFAFNVIDLSMPAGEIVGKIALQTAAGSFGAVLAAGQLSTREEQTNHRRERRLRYPGTLLLMAAGALFLGLNVAPTEEMSLLAYMMTPLHEISLVLLSLALMHAFVYLVRFPGGQRPQSDVSFFSLFARFTVTGYAMVLLISLYLLWTFGQTAHASTREIVSSCIVLAFPGAIGAAAARLIL